MAVCNLPFFLPYIKGQNCLQEESIKCWVLSDEFWIQIIFTLVVFL